MSLATTILILFCVSASHGYYKYYEEGSSAVLECVPAEGEVKYWFLHGKGKSIGVDETPQNGVFMNPNGTLQFQLKTIPKWRKRL
ncbi:hypothetical protein Avbf_11677 [Armadillidium vulgare]|nr:hypothetical protein Avbf_11677 [Armadillidium vulgare]